MHCFEPVKSLWVSGRGFHLLLPLLTAMLGAAGQCRYPCEAQPSPSLPQALSQGQLPRSRLWALSSPPQALDNALPAWQGMPRKRPRDTLGSHSPDCPTGVLRSVSALSHPCPDKAVPGRFRLHPVFRGGARRGCPAQHPTAWRLARRSAPEAGPACWALSQALLAVGRQWPGRITWH